MSKAFSCTMALSITVALLVTTVSSAALPQRPEKRALGLSAKSHHGYGHHSSHGGGATHDANYHHHVHTVGRPAVGGGLLHGNLALTAGGLHPYAGGIGYPGLGSAGLYGLYGGGYPVYGLSGLGLGGAGLGIGGVGLGGVGLGGIGLGGAGLYGGGLGGAGLGGAGLYGSGLGLNTNLGFSYGW